MKNIIKKIIVFLSWCAFVIGISCGISAMIDAVLRSKGF